MFESTLGNWVMGTQKKVLLLWNNGMVHGHCNGCRVDLQEGKIAR